MDWIVLLILHATGFLSCGRFREALNPVLCNCCDLYHTMYGNNWARETELQSGLVLQIGLCLSLYVVFEYRHVSTIVGSMLWSIYNIYSRYISLAGHKIDSIELQTFLIYCQLNPSPDKSWVVCTYTVNAWRNSSISSRCTPCSWSMIVFCVYWSVGIISFCTVQNIELYASLAFSLHLEYLKSCLNETANVTTDLE